MSGDGANPQSGTNKTDTYRKEVKPFGDGGAHITVPSTLIGETVKITRLDWDDTLDGEIIRENGEEFATCIETPIGTEVYAAPDVRERFTEQTGTINVGVLQKTGDTTQELEGENDAGGRDGVGEEFTLPMSVLQSNVTIVGDSGNGKPAFMTNLAYQYALGDTSGGFCVIGDENGGIGDFTSLLESRDIDFEYIDTTKLTGADDVREAVSNTSPGVPVVVHVPMTMYTGGTRITSAIVDELSERVTSEDIGGYPVFIDMVYPDEFTASQLASWDDSGVSLVMGVQYIEQFSDSVVTWITSNSEVMSFSVTPETAGRIASELVVADPDRFVGRACGLNRGEIMLCERDEAVVLTYPESPPV